MGRAQSLLVLSFVFMLLFNVGKTETEDVRDALVIFMNKLEPGNMQNRANWGWNNTSDPCTSGWFGVTCDISNQNVKNIVLEQLSLTGTVDFESVCKETSLLKLSLKNNNLSGSLQNEISNCKILRHLFLNGNRFSNNLPNSLTNLTNLVRINISNNDFSGNLPDMSKNLGLLSFLAQNNHFSGQLPNFNYDHLQEFNVSNNDLKGQVPDNTGAFGAKSFMGNSGLCGKLLSNACSENKKPKSHEFLMYSGFVILSLSVLVLIGLLYLKKKENRNDMKSDSEVVISTKDSEPKSRSEFSITSAENGGISNSAFVLSSPVEAVNGLKFEDLLRAPAEVIGKGKNGSLYKVVTNVGMTLVVKRIKDWDISKDEFKKRMQRIDQVKHCNVLPVVAYYCSKKEKLLVYEFQQNGSLFDLLHGSQDGQIFDWGSRLNIASDAAEALALMHKELKDDQIPHGNLKSSNILLSKDMEACVSEYGLMVVDNDDSQKNDNNVLDADVYAFGVVLLELLTGKPVQSNGVDLAKWINLVVKDEWTGEVFDKVLMVEGANEERMVALLQIALKCINGALDLRPNMDQVSKMIVSLKEEADSSIASSSSGP